MTTYQTFNKQSEEEKEEKYMLRTDEYVRTNSQATFSNGLLHMDAPILAE